MKIKLPHAGFLLSPAVPAGAADPALGDLPVWKLQDLYPSATSTAFVADMEKAGKAAIAFEEKWKSKLTEAAAKTGAEGIGAALKEYEALDDIIGRLGSFAGLTYFSDTTNPTNGKLYGDVQAKITEFSGHLLFFALELNRIDDAVIDACMANDPAAGHYRPWLLDLRKDKPYQLDDRLEQLFLEKSMTSAAAFNRLFDETMAELRYDIDGEKVPLEVALNRLQEKDPEARRKAAMALAETFKANIRTFTLITNTLAKDKEIADRWRGFEDIADSRHGKPCRARGRRCAGRGRPRSLSPPFASLLQDEGEMARYGADEFLGPQRAPSGNLQRHHLGRRRRIRCCRPMAILPRRWRISPGASSTNNGSMPRSVPARRQAPSPIRRFPRLIPMCSSITWASRAM